MKQWFRFIALVLAISLNGAFGQVVTASLDGTVTDPSGAGVPHANVEVQNTSTGVSMTVQTSDNGHFVAPSLQPGGPYRIRVTANGFKSAERSGIPLDVNQQATVNIPLELGSSTQTVQVTGEAPLLESSSAAIGQVVDNKSKRAWEA